MYKFWRASARRTTWIPMNRLKLPMRMAALLAVMLLASCVSQPRQSSTEQTATGSTRTQMPMPPMPRDIQYLLAKAERSAPPKSIELRLSAAEMAADSKNAQEVRSILGMIGTIQDPELKGRYLLLEANLALLEQEPNKALQWLNDSRLTSLKLTIEQRIRAGQIRAGALFDNRSYLASARARIQIDELLNATERVGNHELIFSTLMELPADALSNNAKTSISSDVRGWLSLAAMARRYQNDPLKQLSELDKWKQLWAGHPAAVQLPKSLQMLGEVVAQQPKTIALLLPLSGDLGPYGRAIRDGFLAAHYNATSGTEIKVYDTSTGDITTLLNQARAEGAQLAIGPLDRRRVTTLAHDEALPIPVLALNRTLDGSVNPNLYQFGLAPEDEDDQVADEVFREGKRNALVIYPTGDWGTRNFDEFKKRWQSLGGTIVDSAQFSAQRDYSDMIKDLLNVDQSEERATELRRITGQKFEFTPRRRQDLDFIFLLADSAEARKINPTLAFYYAQNLPVYATSHIHEGAISRINTMDLNGIRFCDLPWKLIHTGDLQAQVVKLWPAAKDNSLAPFYALGIDAYRLYPRLQQMTQVPNAKLFGNTGVLQLNSDHIVTRTLMWAEFSDGRVVPMPVVMPGHAG